MNREQMINKIKQDITLYNSFTFSDYPDLGIHSSQYMDILVKLFSDSKIPYSLIYTDVNKLSVVNERFGKEAGDNALHSLLTIFTSNPLLKNSITVRTGGDEFITFVPNKEKAEVEKILDEISNTVEEQKETLHGSGLSFGVAASSSGDVQKLICLAEHEADIAKNKNRKNDAFLEEATSSEDFIELPIPQDISKEQKQKWEILNTKINIATDNHLRDLRPSSNVFEYKVNHIQSDIIAFITSFRNLLEKKETIHSSQPENDASIKDDFEISPESASIIHSLFQGNGNLEALDDKQLEDVSSSLDNWGKNLIRDKHSGLFSKAYYKLFLADELLKSKQNYQAICISMAGIRPSNTAYGHSITDDRIEKTIPLIVESFKKNYEFNNTPFAFDKKDVFFVDQGGGNYLAFIPENKALGKNDINEILDSVNAHFSDGPDSTFKIAVASKKNVNRFTIPFFVNSMNNVPNNPIEWSRTLFQIIKNRAKKRPSLKSAPFEEYSNKPFVQFARKLEEICNDHKDSLKVESLSSNINQKSVESVMNDLANYYINEIEDSDSIENKKFLLENVMLSLSNHEAYINKLSKESFDKKREERKILKPIIESHNHDNNVSEDERE